MIGKQDLVFLMIGKPEQNLVFLMITKQENILSFKALSKSFPRKEIIYVINQIFGYVSLQMVRKEEEFVSLRFGS